MIRVALAFFLALCSAANAQLSGGLQFPGPGTAHSAGVTLSLDGSGFSSVGSTNTNTVPLTTSKTNDEILVFFAVNGAAVSDTILVTASGLAFTPRGSSTGVMTPNGNPIMSYSAPASAIFSGTIQVAITPGASINYLEILAFGVNGIKTSAPFDVNVSLPAGATSGAVTYSTTGGADFIFAGFRSTGPTDSGWTNIVTGSFMSAEYKTPMPSSAQTSQTVGGSNGHNGGLVDALVQGP